MKRYLLLLSLLPLILSSISIGYTTEYGNGIDPSRTDWLKYLTDESLAREFTVPSGNYNIYIAVGKYNDDPSASASVLYIELREGGITGFTIRDVYVNLSIFNTVKIFNNITLSSGTYAIVITPLGDGDNFYYIGAYRGTNLTYAYYNDWVRIDYDIAISVKDVENDQYGLPAITITGRHVGIDKVTVTFKLENFQPGSTAEVYAVLVESTVDTAFAGPVEITISNDGSAMGSIDLQYSYKEAVLKVRGYDRYGNQVIVYSNEPIGIDFRPKSLFDQIGEWFQALYSYAGLAFATVKAIVPYAGTFYLLALVGAMFSCLKELSIQPLFDFFYKQYSMLLGLANVAIKIAEKVYQGFKIIAQIIITAIASLI